MNLKYIWFLLNHKITLASAIGSFIGCAIYHGLFGSMLHGLLIGAVVAVCVVVLMIVYQIWAQSPRQLLEHSKQLRQQIDECIVLLEEMLGPEDEVQA